MNQEPFQLQVIQKTLQKAKEHIFENKLDKADEILVKAIQSDLHHSDLFYLAGEVKRLIGDNEAAERYLLSALSYEVHSPYVYQSLGLCYTQLQHYERSLQLLTRFQEFYEKEEINFEIGKCYSKMNQYLKAIEYFTRAINQNPLKGLYYLYRGDVNEALKFQDLAYQDFNKFKQLTPNYRNQLVSQVNQLQQQNLFMQAQSIQNLLKKIS